MPFSYENFTVAALLSLALRTVPERKLNLVNTEINGKKKSLSGGGQVSWGSRVWGGEAWGPDQWKERGTGSLRAGAR